MASFGPSGRWIWTALTSVLVIGAVAYPFLLGQQPAAAARDAAVSNDAPLVHEGSAYYVLLSSIEVEPKDADGNRWDIGRAAPDVYYEVSWRDTDVFRSSTKAQTLLARWSNSELGIKDVVGTVSIDGSIKAARVTARLGEWIEFRVWDDDVAKDDPIASWKMRVMDLREGEQIWTEPSRGLVQVVCRVLPVDDVDLGTLTR